MQSGRLSLLSLLALMLLAPTGLCRGAGFAIHEGSARGNALGGALVARADDPSVLFYNPAGMTRLPGSQVMGGATAILPATEVTTTYNDRKVSSSTKTNAWLPPHLYATRQCTDALWFGLGVFSRFGLGTQFDPNWPGRYNNTNAVIQTLAVNPNAAIKINDALSLAVGATWMWLDLTLEQKIAFPNLTRPDPDTDAGDVDQCLTGDSVGYGFNAALHYKACDRLAIGMSYHSKVKQKIDGEVAYAKPGSVEAMFPTIFNDTSAWGEIVLPDMASFGLAFYPVDRLSVEIGGTWTGWSTFEKLTIHYGAPILDPVKPGVTNSTKEKKWNDVWRLQAGVEYEFLNGLDLRCGYVWDASPVPDETADYLVPANDRHLYSLGSGFHRGPWTLDVSYTYLHITGRTVRARPEDGIFDSEFENGRAHLIGFSLGYRF